MRPVALKLRPAQPDWLAAEPLAAEPGVVLVLGYVPALPPLLLDGSVEEPPGVLCACELSAKPAAQATIVLSKCCLITCLS